VVNGVYTVMHRRILLNNLKNCIVYYLVMNETIYLILLMQMNKLDVSYKKY